MVTKTTAPQERQKIQTTQENLQLKESKTREREAMTRFSAIALPGA